MTDTLYPHQVACAQYALDHLPGGVGLFMEQRTGKSRTAIEVARRLGAQRVLVLCPSQAGSVPKVWMREVPAAWPGSPRVVNLTGTTAERARTLVPLDGKPAIVVCNYEAAWREPLASVIGKQQWDVLIADEVHRLKSPKGTASTFVARLARHVPHRLGLTGTPIPHSPLDVWGIWQCIDWTVFSPSYTKFRLRYSTPTASWERGPETYVTKGRGGALQRWKFRDVDEIHDAIYAQSVRVLARDVFPDMPPEMDEMRSVALEPSAMKAYRQMEQDMVMQLDSGVVSASNAGVAVLRLQQLTGGTLAVEDIETGERTETQVSTAKETLLHEMLEDMDGHPVVVFGRFHADLDAIRRAAEAAGLTVSELSGRRRELDAWQAGETQVLAVQIQAGGVGIDLTRASIAVYYSLGHSLTDYVQSRSRLLGPRQTEPAMFYHLLAERTVDEQIYSALRARRDVVGYIVEQHTREVAYG